MEIRLLKSGPDDDQSHSSQTGLSNLFFLNHKKQQQQPHTLCARISLGPQSHRLHFNSVREIYALKSVARRENYPLEICLTGDDLTDFSPRQTINLSNWRRRHRFFTETNNKSV